MTVITLSERGSPVGKKVSDLFPGSKLVNFKENDSTLSSIFSDAWDDGPIIAIMAAQITVRMIADKVSDKKIDPAVISIDEGGQFVIPLLSGHLGGANALSKKIAQELGAQAVVTTASDLMGVPALDELSQELGYKMQNPHILAAVMTRILNKKKVCLFGDEQDVQVIASRFGDVPFDKRPMEKYMPGNGSERIVLSDLDIPESSQDLILQPVRNHLGIGFRKGASIDMLRASAKEALAACKIAPGTIATISTIDIKAQTGLVEELAGDYGARVIYYTKEQLSKEVDISGQSEFVRESVGVGAVSEPAAKLSSGGGKIIQRKFIHGGVALSIAKANWP